MTSDVALDSGQLDSPLSAFSSPSQASDASSSAAGRVFFGPVRSPEKKFVRRAGSASFRTPVRRSARLSSAMVPLPLFPQHHAAVLGDYMPSSQDGTPNEDGADEPSVILASRVLSAAGNPSPPPSPPLPPQPEPSSYMDVQLLDVSNSPQPPAAAASPHCGLLIPIEGISDPVANSSPIVPRLTPPTPPGPDVANTSQPDLITFDSFSAAHDDDEPPTTEAHDHELLPAQPSNATVDDLLSMSPNPPPTASATTQQPNVFDPPPSEDLGDNTEPEDEMEVANSLIIEADSAEQPGTDTDVAQPDQEYAQVTEVETAEAPLRRSARPRRSRNSLPQTVATPPPPPIPPLPLAQAVEIEMTTEDDSQQRPEPSPFRKRKLKVVPPLDANIAASSGATYATTPKKTPQAALAQRKLGSLSPMSSAVLTQLLPKPAGDSASRSNTPQPPETDTGPSEPVPPPAPSTPPPHAINLVFPKVGAVDGTATDIQRPKSPLRPFPASPFKLEEVARTPARRVPISQAIADGTYSTQKIPALFSASRPTAIPGTPVFRRTALDDPLRSPARRVPMSEAVPIPPSSPDKGKNVFRPLSPMRMASRERQRSGSAEPKPQPGRKERGASAEPTTRPPALGRRPVFQKPASTEGVASGSSLLKPRTALPFPLGQSQRLHPAIPETDEPGPSAVRPPVALPCTVAPAVSPAKGVSSLRQPSAGSGSKIPRIGAKPYGRPKTATQSRLPAPTKSSTARKPLRIVSVGSSSSGGSSDEGHGVPPSAAKPSHRRQPGTAPSETTSVHGVKRKREVEPPKPTIPAPQPVIVIRKVVPGMFNKGEKAAGSTSAATAQTKELVPAPSPAKASGPIRARSAANWKRPQPQNQPPPSPMPPIPQTAIAQPPEPEPVQAPAPVLAPVPRSTPVETAQASPVKEAREVISPPLLPAAPASSTALTATSNDAPAPGPSTAPEPAEEKPGRHRRSTRSKRSLDGATAAAADVFGTLAPSTRPPPRRRPAPLPFLSESGPFAGMSALALKTLTSANTAKNQQQVAVLQTEVVRKEGARPDSPTTKVRSALERQREERVVQRQARAERRARRSGGDPADGASTAEGAGGTGAGEGEAGSEMGDMSFMSVDHDSEGQPMRHRRAPGDEEEYETPQKPERPAKRARFDGGEENEKEDEAHAKRVKWDKGLQTTVYLDDSPPKPRRNKGAVPAHKGCLTPAAKALRLDTLGNVLNAELPVGGLVRENIVVKKFVFDDDEVAAAPESVEPAPVVKSTRSKSKKAKS